MHRSVIAGLYGKYMFCFIFKETAKLSSRVAVSLVFPPPCKRCHFSVSSPAFGGITIFSSLFEQVDSDIVVTEFLLCTIDDKKLSSKAQL